MANEDWKNLTDLKTKLWTKITYLDAKLQTLEEDSGEYRRSIDMYHKLVKSFLDIVKVMRYAPGLQEGDESDDDWTSLLRKVRAGSNLEPEEKKTLQDFKDFIVMTVKEKDSEPAGKTIGQVMN